MLFPITDAACQCAPCPLFCYKDDNNSDTKIGKIFKERCLSLTITLSLSTWYHFKAHDLLFSIVLSECKSKLYFSVKYLLPNSTDSLIIIVVCLVIYTACCIAFSTINTTTQVKFGLQCTSVGSFSINIFSLSCVSAAYSES